MRLVQIQHSGRTLQGNIKDKPAQSLHYEHLFKKNILRKSKRLKRKRENLQEDILREIVKDMSENREKIQNLMLLQRKSLV